MILLILGVTNVLSNPSSSCVANLRITDVQSVRIEKNGTCVISFNSDKGSIKFDKVSKENSCEVPKNLSTRLNYKNCSSISRDAQSVRRKNGFSNPLYPYTNNPTGPNNFRYSDKKINPLAGHSYNNSFPPDYLNIYKEENGNNKRSITKRNPNSMLPPIPKEYNYYENIKENKDSRNSQDNFYSKGKGHFRTATGQTEGKVEDNTGAENYYDEIKHGRNVGAETNNLNEKPSGERAQYFDHTDQNPPIKYVKNNTSKVIQGSDEITDNNMESELDETTPTDYNSCDGSSYFSAQEDILYPEDHYLNMVGDSNRKLQKQFPEFNDEANVEKGGISKNCDYVCLNANPYKNAPINENAPGVEKETTKSEKKEKPHGK